MGENRGWWYAVGVERRGPVSSQELRALVLREEVARDVLVWREGMLKWQPLDATEGGTNLLGSLPPPLDLQPAERELPELSSISEPVSAVSPNGRSDSAGYLLDHWRGRHSLARSIWLNTILPNAFLLPVAYFTLTAAFGYGGEGVAIMLLAVSVILGCWQYGGIVAAARRVARDRADKRVLARAIEVWVHGSLALSVLLLVGALIRTDGVLSPRHARTVDDLTQHPSYYSLLRHYENEGHKIPLEEEWAYLRPRSNSARASLIVSALGTSVGSFPALLTGPWSTLAATAMSRLGQEDLLAYANKVDGVVAAQPKLAQPIISQDSKTSEQSKNVQPTEQTSLPEGDAATVANRSTEEDLFDEAVVARISAFAAEQESADRLLARASPNATVVRRGLRALADAVPKSKRRRESPLQVFGDGLLRDPLTDKTWTRTDNGANIDWHGANQWCAERGDGWRLPSADELREIHDPKGPNGTPCGSRECKVSELFELSASTFWSKDHDDSERTISVYLGDKDLSFWEVKSASDGLRALCLRDGQS